jgi:hypothetical protein
MDPFLVHDAIEESSLFCAQSNTKPISGFSSFVCIIQFKTSPRVQQHQAATAQFSIPLPPCRSPNNNTPLQKISRQLSTAMGAILSNYSVMWSVKQEANNRLFWFQVDVRFGFSGSGTILNCKDLAFWRSKYVSLCHLVDQNDAFDNRFPLLECSMVAGSLRSEDANRMTWLLTVA